MAKVTLITHTPDPEKLVAAAAKLCYSSSDIPKLMNGLTPEKTDSFLEMLTDIGHASPVEHVTFTFGIEDVSRSLLAQITRHRIASFSVQSQRYVKENVDTAGSMEGNFYVTPPEIENIPRAKELFVQSMNQAMQSYRQLADLLEEKHYQDKIAQGIPEKQARSAAEKKAIEDARFVLPNACVTKMVVTMNARSLENFFRLRCCKRAQWEIRQVANQMLKLVKEVAPTLFRQAGAPCVMGPCLEGKLSCGQPYPRSNKTKVEPDEK